MKLMFYYVCLLSKKNVVTVPVHAYEVLVLVLLYELLLCTEYQVPGTISTSTV